MIGLELLGPRLGQSMFDDFVGHPKTLTPSVREGYWFPLHEGTTRTMRYFAQSERSLPEHFPRYQAALRKPNVPAMLICIKSDQALDCEVMTGKVARDLNIPNEYIHNFEDAKHFLWKDNPDDIVRLIASFVKRLHATKTLILYRTNAIGGTRANYVVTNVIIKPDTSNQNCIQHTHLSLM